MTARVWPRDVVHLAGDAGAFLRGGEPGLLVALFPPYVDVGVGRPQDQAQCANATTATITIKVTGSARVTYSSCWPRQKK